MRCVRHVPGLPPVPQTRYYWCQQNEAKGVSLGVCTRKQEAGEAEKKANVRVRIGLRVESVGRAIQTSGGP